MSIPRAKITHDSARGMFESRPNCGCLQLIFVAESIDMASDLTRGHFWEEHGVRTVGSLTADDIGKWIEVDERPLLFGVLTGVSHDRMTATYTLVHSGALSQIMPPSTPCRVTEAKP